MTSLPLPRKFDLTPLELIPPYIPSVYLGVKSKVGKRPKSNQDAPLVEFSKRRVTSQKKITPQYNVPSVGKPIQKSQKSTSTGAMARLKYLDWSNPYVLQSIGDNGINYCPRDGVNAYIGILYKHNSNSNNSSFGDGLDSSSGSQDCIGVSACNNVPLAVSSVNEQSAVSTISGCVAVSSCNDSSLPVSGSIIVSNWDSFSSIEVNNFPDTQNVSGTVNISQTETLDVSGEVSSVITNFPSIQEVSGTVSSNVTFPISQTVDGSLSVDNFPATQTVDGSVSVSNLDEVSAVKVNNLDEVSSLSVDNFPATQGVSGTILDDIKSEIETSNDNTANTLTLKRQVINNDPQGLPVQTGLGGLETSIIPSTNAYLSRVFLDLDANNSNPLTDTTLVAAQGAGTKIVVYGWSLSWVGTTAASFSNFVITNGGVAGGDILFGTIAPGTDVEVSQTTLPYGLALSDNTPLKFTSSEVSGNLYVYGTVYYRVE